MAGLDDGWHQTAVGTEWPRVVLSRRYQQLDCCSREDGRRDLRVWDRHEDPGREVLLRRAAESHLRRLGGWPALPDDQGRADGFITGTIRRAHGRRQLVRRAEPAGW